MAHVELSGSARPLLAGARCIGDAGSDEQVRAVLVLRRPHPDEWRDRGERLLAGEPAPALSRQAFAKRFGASTQDLDAVERFGRQSGLEVLQRDAASGTVTLGGPVARFNSAFGVVLRRYQHAGGVYRSCDGPVCVPDALRDAVTAVMGLDDRPQARAHFRFRPPFRPAQGRADTSYLPTEVADLYDFPESTGAGQCLGLIELGGAYRAEDAKSYFSALGLAAPEVTVVAADGTSPTSSGGPQGADGEVMLDVEIAGAVAPQAGLVLYFAANTDAGFIQALNSAVHDDAHRPSIISISWGGPEPSWSPQSLRAFGQALQAAAMMGVTVCAASGDSGASDGLPGGDHVDFPAASPYVLACGGTRLESAARAIGRETVWNDGPGGGAGGGGVSAVFALPEWQRQLSVSGGQGASRLERRGVPDVAANADPATGYRVRVDGKDQVVGGTSAVAPLWAGLFARINASRSQPAGYVNARLYGAPSAFNDITQGDNGGFRATKGWDACTGLGSPNGRKVAGLFSGGAT